MTTKEAEARYLADHQAEVRGQGVAIYNPHNKPEAELPRIYGFVNGGNPGWLDCIAVSADGHALAGHMCSNEGYLPHDLGILEGSRPDRHEESYKKHYPDGYVMEHVPRDKLMEHVGFRAAVKLARDRSETVQQEKVNE